MDRPSSSFDYFKLQAAPNRIRMMHGLSAKNGPPRRNMNPDKKPHANSESLAPLSGD